MVFLISLKVLIPIILVIIILITILWILYIKNRELFSKLNAEKQNLASYKQSTKNLQNSENTSQTFKKLNTLSRKFFKEYFNLSYSLTYLELSRQFEKNKKPNYADFCKQMSDIKYQGEKITNKQIKDLISMFSKIVEEY